MSLTYRIYRGLARAIVALWAPLRVEHGDRIPAQGSAVLIANHRSLMDPILLLAISDRPVLFMAAGYILKLPVIGAILRPLSLPTGSVGALRQALHHLESGGMVALFPEGGVRTADTLEGLGDSAAYLAARSGAVVVPVAIRGAAAVLPPGHYLPRRRPVQIIVGEPTRVGADLKRPQLLAATLGWMAAIAAMSPESSTTGR